MYPIVEGAAIPAQAAPVLLAPLGPLGYTSKGCVLAAAIRAISLNTKVDRLRSVQYLFFNCCIYIMYKVRYEGVCFGD